MDFIEAFFVEGRALLVLFLTPLIESIADMIKKISILSLSILIVSSVANLKNAPAAALLGSPLLFFFFISALIFLIPGALVSAQLSAAFPEKGGIYHWVQAAFGKRWGMSALWLQWINTIAWYPTILSFIAATLAYALFPEWGENKTYLIGTILSIFWGLTWLNLKGIHASTKFTNYCALIGTMFPIGLLIVLGGIWLYSGESVHISFEWREIVPSFRQGGTWVSLIAIMASFLGIELSSVHVNEMQAPEKNFPKALLLAAFAIFLLMALSALSISIVLPPSEINLVGGVMQVFQNFFSRFGLSSLLPWMALSIAIGSIGTMVNWLISPAKGLLHAAEVGFLPSFFSRTNRAGVASNILLAQAVFVSLFCLGFLFQPSVNGFFWFLTSLSTELYMMMYVLMFLSALKLRYSNPNRFGGFQIPGGRVGLWVVATLGLFGSFLTTIVTFFPPENMEVGGSLRYLLMIGVGNVITLSPLLVLFAIEKRRRQQIA